MNLGIIEVLFLLVTILFIVALVASYHEIHNLEKVIYKLTERSQRDSKIIARYEIAIQCLPADWQEKLNQRIYEEYQKEKEREKKRISTFKIS